MLYLGLLGVHCVLATKSGISVTMLRRHLINKQGWTCLGWKGQLRRALVFAEPVGGGIQGLIGSRWLFFPVSQGQEILWIDIHAEKETAPVNAHRIHEIGILIYMNGWFLW